MSAEFKRGFPIEKVKSSRELYYYLLGLESFPKNPKELPLSFEIPSDALESLEDAIFMTKETGEERGQFVYFVKNIGFVKPPIRYGDRESVEISAFSLKFLNRLVKPLIYYHTHPGPDITALPSSDDVDLFSRFPRVGYIMLIATNEWITAMVQTENFEHAEHNLNETSRVLEIMGKIEHSDSPSTLPMMGALLERIGLGLYFQDSGKLRGYRKGDLSGNLRLNKVRYIGQE
ncbi:hypothetical protein IID21_03125 [Patescibacteria group bacterium]|nr:hypothetical protein [Patescibacteria group bacterium]